MRPTIAPSESRKAPPPRRLFFPRMSVLGLTASGRGAEGAQARFLQAGWRGGEVRRGSDAAFESAGTCPAVIHRRKRRRDLFANQGPSLSLECCLFEARRNGGVDADVAALRVLIDYPTLPARRRTSDPLPPGSSVKSQPMTPLDRPFGSAGRISLNDRGAKCPVDNSLRFSAGPPSPWKQSERSDGWREGFSFSASGREAVGR